VLGSPLARVRAAAAAVAGAVGQRAAVIQQYFGAVNRTDPDAARATFADRALYT
jgi:hypothetical protein